MLACKIMSVEQSPSSEAESSSASQKIARILWERPVRYCIHNIPPLSPVLNQINPDQDLLFYLWKIHFNIISACSLDLFPSRFTRQNRVSIYIFSNTCHMFPLSSSILSPR